MSAPEPAPPHARPGWWQTVGLSGALLLAVAIAMRVHNALAYPRRWGYDALYNERYVDLLLASWALPAPDSDWSTAHPPLFYYAAAAVGRALGLTDGLDTYVPVRLASAGLGLLLCAGATFAVARRLAPDDPLRARLAAGLLLLLPVQIYMGAMLNEELMAASLATAALAGAVIELSRPVDAPRRGARDVGIGLAAGLALLTKLSGVLVIASVTAAYAIAGWRQGRLAVGLRRAVLVGIVASLVGGWFYFRNLALYGYLYPQDLSTHTVMFSMPPGERGIGDYLRVPLATFTDPQALHPDLLRSVWGTTYASAWFEPHRHFLPAGDPDVRRMGTAILVLALLPTAAFLVGAVRGARRLRKGAVSPDLPMLLLLASTAVGYVVFTWGNPWFVTVKASYGLSLSLPFAWYASGTLLGWARGSGERSLAVWIPLAVLAAAIVVSFTLGLGPWTLAPPGSHPGIPWQGLQ